MGEGLSTSASSLPATASKRPVSATLLSRVGVVRMVRFTDGPPPPTETNVSESTKTCDRYRGCPIVQFWTSGHRSPEPRNTRGSVRYCGRSVGRGSRDGGGCTRILGETCQGEPGGEKHPQG